MVFDIIFAVLVIASLIWGVMKGFIKLALAILGVFVVATLTATISPYFQKLFESVIEDENVRTIIAMIVTVIVLAVVYSIVAHFVGKLLTRIKVLNVINRILGAAMGVVFVYMVFAVFVSLVKSTDESFLALLKNWMGDTLTNSWVINNIYSNNFFGDWVVLGIAQKLLDSLNSAGENARLSLYFA